MRENRLIFGRDEAVAAWVARQLGCRGFGPCRAIAIASGDRPLGGVVYSHYYADYQTIQMSIATVSPLWAQRGTIRALLSVAFHQYKCYKVCAVTELSNTRSQRFLEKIGMKSEATLRHQFGPKKHAKFYGMTEPEFRSLWMMKEAA